MTISKITAVPYTPLQIEGVPVNNLQLLVFGLSKEVFQLIYPNLEREREFLEKNPNLVRVSKLFVNPLEDILVGYYSNPPISNELIQKIDELEEEEEPLNSEFHFVTLLDSSASIDMVPIRTLFQGNQVQVTLNEIWTKEKMQNIVLKASLKIDQEKGALDQLWDFLKFKLGENNLKYVRGIQPRHKGIIGDGKDRRTLLEEAFLGDLCPISNNLNLSKKISFGYQLVEGLFWLQSVHFLHTDIKPENCFYNETQAVLADFEGGRLYTPDEILGKSLRASAKYFDCFGTSKVYLENIKAGRRLEALQNIKELQLFSFGLTLVKLFDLDMPRLYKTVSLDNGGVIVNRDFLIKNYNSIAEQLMEEGCPVDLACFIEQCLNPLGPLRPNVDYMKRIILKNNPQLEAIISLI